jgi:integrase/recombinase XerD
MAKPTPPEFMKWLDDQLGERDWSDIIRDLKRYIGRELKRYGPHTHRHTFATVNLRGTHDLKTTSMILGHSTTRTTERYTHLTGTDVLRNSEGSPMDDLIRGRRNGRDTSHASRKVD